MCITCSGTLLIAFVLWLRANLQHKNHGELSLDLVEKPFVKPNELKRFFVVITD